MLRIEALPAGDGDCLWVEWPHAGRTHRMLIDGGRGQTITTRLAQQSPQDRHIDVVVCTHIDADHIEGLLALFADPPEGFTVDDVWFNGSRHLRPDVTGPRQGDRLERLLVRNAAPWNMAFGRGPVVVPDSGVLPVVRMPGLTVTLLAPHPSDLARLDAAWPQVIVDEQQLVQAPRPRTADLDAGIPLSALVKRPYEPDSSPANGSSLAFLAEHEDGARVLFAADAPAESLLRGLRALAPDWPLPLDLCKVPHHGSGHNVSADLVAAVDCRHWLISTSGARHGHPDRRAIARIVAGTDAPVLWFNYRSSTTVEYADPDAGLRDGYRAAYPTDNQSLTLLVSPSQVRLASTGLAEQILPDDLPNGPPEAR